LKPFVWLCAAAFQTTSLPKAGADLTNPLCFRCSYLVRLQSVLRVDAKPFISAALLRLFGSALRPATPLPKAAAGSANPLSSAARFFRCLLLNRLQSVLRADAKPFISATLRRLFGSALRPLKQHLYSMLLLVKPTHCAARFLRCSRCIRLQSVLRVDAKPFISAALRRLFGSAPQPGGPGLAFLAAPHDLAWDVPMRKVGCRDIHIYMLHM
jgi:hypothetical protein